MSPLRRAGVQYGRYFPRVSGDEPYTPGAMHSASGFSPRERG